MATTTAALTLSSSDLTSDALSLSKTATLTAAGSSTTGLSETSGIARKKYTGSPADNVIGESDNYTTDRAHKVYLFNTSTTSTEFFIIKVGAQVVGRLYAGDWLYMPWSGSSDVTAQPSESTDMTIEFAIFGDEA